MFIVLADELQERLFRIKYLNRQKVTNIFSGLHFQFHVEKEKEKRKKRRVGWLIQAISGSWSFLAAPQKKWKDVDLFEDWRFNYTYSFTVSWSYDMMFPKCYRYAFLVSIGAEKRIVFTYSLCVRVRVRVSFHRVSNLVVMVKVRVRGKSMSALTTVCTWIIQIDIIKNTFFPHLGYLKISIFQGNNVICFMMNNFIYVFVNFLII